jgi:hypothetical protein
VIQPRQPPAPHVLSRRALEELAALQENMRVSAAERRVAMRILVASRHAATASAQQEFWMEFTCADHEYRVAVRRLAVFCREHRDGSPRGPAALQRDFAT